MLDALRYIASPLTDPNDALPSAAVARDWQSLRFASYAVSNHRPTIKLALKQSGMALEYASAVLQDDRKLVLFAVRNTGIALQHASMKLRADEKVVLEAVRQNWLALRYASHSARKATNVTRVAVSQNGFALRYAMGHLDKQIVLSAVEHNWRCIWFVCDPALEKDPEVIRAVDVGSTKCGIPAAAVMERLEEYCHPTMARAKSCIHYIASFLQPFIEMDYELCFALTCTTFRDARRRGGRALRTTDHGIFCDLKRFVWIRSFRKRHQPKWMARWDESTGRVIANRQEDPTT